jgi:hypothetical protein
MTPEDLRLLAVRATTVESSPEQLQRDVHARISTMRRRRHLVAVAATVVAVALVVTAGTAVLKVAEADPPPAKPPAPTTIRPPVPDQVQSARPLVYAEDDEVHVGGRTVVADDLVIDIDVVDGGAVFATETFHRRLISTVWFTDGSRVTEIGRTRGSVITSGVGMTGSSFGPFMVLSDVVTGDEVVYDTGRLHEVGRLGSAAAVVAVDEHYVYWTPATPDGASCADNETDANGCNRYRDLRRFDVRRGTQVRVSWASYIADRRSRPRLLSSTGADEPVFFEKTHFTRHGDRLVGGDLGLGQTYTVRDARTGTPIPLRLPRGYDAAQDNFHLAQWLDDESFTVVAGWYGHDELTDGDILLCRTSGGRCRVLVPGGPPVTDAYHGRRVPGAGAY